MNSKHFISLPFLSDRNRRYVKRFIIPVCIILILFINTSLWSFCEKRKENNEFVTLFTGRKFQQKSHKTILLWSPLFEWDTWFVSDRKLSRCTEYMPRTCELTTDRDQLENSDAVLFHFPNIDVLPVRKQTHQIWIYFNMEALPNVLKDFTKYNGVFNWTTSFRRDSTIPMAYGSYRKKVKRENKIPDIFSTKTKMAFWAASNCVDPNQRYRVVYDLQKYIQLDTYGECGDMECPLSQDICFKIFSEYKFALSFENSYCRDYVTEKFWNALRRRQIPIVYGGADYESIAPYNSFIDVRDFHNISELASYVLKVSNNRTLYNSYFDWMKEYDVEPCGVQERLRNCFQTDSYFCNLCGALHNSSVPAQVFTDLRGWALDDLPQCKENTFFSDWYNKLSRSLFLLGL